MFPCPNPIPSPSPNPSPPPKPNFNPTASPNYNSKTVRGRWLGLFLGAWSSIESEIFTGTRKQETHPPQWFRAEEKEKQGFLEFTAWEPIAPAQVTPEIRKRALRCHHIYDIKRDSSAKNRVVMNGSRQHSDTYTDTTSPVASQLQLPLSLSQLLLLSLSLSLHYH
jgi:hypothetical protein